MSFGGRGRGFGSGGAGRGSFGISAESGSSNGGFGSFGLSGAAPADDGWDDAPAAKSNGDGGGGFGNDNSNGFGSSGGGGFGSTSGGGFGSSGGGGGFGSSGGGGFGSSGGGGGGGFGSSGGGFGSTGGGGGGGRACFKCGEEGHMSRECPSGGGGGGGGGGNRACFKCGEEGHMSRECPSGGGGGGGGGNRACFKCGEEGHMSRECPSGGRGSGGGGGGNRACFKCGEEGHMSRECPSGGGGGGGGNRACFKCGEEGHMSRECPSGGGGGGGSRACFKCGEEGHMSRECPNGGGSSSGGFGGGTSGGGFGGSSGGGGFGGSSGGGGFGGSSGGGGFGGSSGGGGGGFGDSGGGGGGFGGDSSGGGGSGCRNCGEDGHFARECPNPRKPQGACRTCNEEGHYSKDCPQNEGKPPSENYVPPEADESEESSSITAGINFDKYDDIPVEISGNNATGPIPTFAEAGLLDTIAGNVKKAKYFKPTPIQKYAIPAIMAGRDLMGCAQTGSGKTAAFLLPVITGMIQKGLESGAFSPRQEPQALVIAPTRELVIQIYNECKKFAMNTIVRCVRLYGGTSTMHQMNDLSKGAHIIIATPGRLLDFIGREKIGLGKLQYLILDEADRMLDMGFEPDMRRLVEQMGMPGKTSRQTLMFSATFPAEIQLLAKDFLNDYIYLTVGVVGGANQDVKQAVLEVPQFEKREKLLEILREHPKQKTLVFVELKRNADFLASMLSQSEFATTSIHGDRLQREREQALADFKAGVAPVLVATSVAARGLDIKGVDHVVNYDLPKEIDEYVHRIGRTGRCGNLGMSTSFYDPDANGDLARMLVRCLAEAHQTVPDFLEKAADRGGSGGGRGGKSSFGGRDARAGGDAGAWDERPSGAAPATADDDESWD